MGVCHTTLQNMLNAMGKPGEVANVRNREFAGWFKKTVNGFLLYIG